MNKLLDNTKLFIFDPETNTYFVKKEDENHNLYKEEYFKNRGELLVYIKSLLNARKRMTLNEIHKEVFEIYNGEKKFPVDRVHKDLEEILDEIAFKHRKTNKWVLKPEQGRFDFKKELSNKLVKITPGASTHSETIFRLVQIGEYLGFSSWIGKREQESDSFQGYNFDIISIKELPIFKISGSQKNKIQQIDVIWFDKLGMPRYAFEVEESTNIMSGFERFKNLMEAWNENTKKMFIIAPRSRKRKIEDVFKNSTYIGHPLYFENKVGLIFRESLVKFYDDHIEEEFDEKDFSNVFEDLTI